MVYVARCMLYVAWSQCVASLQVVRCTLVAARAPPLACLWPAAIRLLRPLPTSRAPHAHRAARWQGSCDMQHAACNTQHAGTTCARPAWTRIGVPPRSSHHIVGAHRPTDANGIGSGVAQGSQPLRAALRTNAAQWRAGGARGGLPRRPTGPRTGLHVGRLHAGMPFVERCAARCFAARSAVGCTLRSRQRRARRGACVRACPRVSGQ